MVPLIRGTMISVKFVSHHDHSSTISWVIPIWQQNNKGDNKWIHYNLIYVIKQNLPGDVVKKITFAITFSRNIDLKMYGRFWSEVRFQIIYTNYWRILISVKYTFLGERMWCQHKTGRVFRVAFLLYDNWSALFIVIKMLSVQFLLWN